MKIAIYTRKSISTDVGDSIGTQIDLIKKYFANKDCTFEVFKDEGFSGGNIKRPAFKLMMNKIKEFDTVAIYKVDRIARNIVDFFNIFNELEKNNVKLVSVSEGFDPSTPGGKLLMTMLAGMAEMERMNIKQRVKDNMIELAKKGKWSGGNLPLGYKSIRVIENGKKCSYLQLNKSDAYIIKEIYDLFLNGYSTRKISFIINEKFGFSTSPTRISKILYSPVYVESTKLVNDYLKLNGYVIYGECNGNGYLTYQKTTTRFGGKRLDLENKTIATPSKHKAIITSESWLKVQKRLKEITKEPRPRISQFTWLAHMVKCGYCGALMHVYSENRKTGNTVRYFRKTCSCSHVGKKIKGSRLTLEMAERYVLEIIQKIKLTGIESFLKQNKNDIEFEINEEMKLIHKQLSDLDSLINGLTNKIALAPDNITEILMNKLSELIENKQSLQEKILNLEQKKNINLQNKNNVTKFNKKVNYFIENFELLSLEEKQLQIQKMFEYFTWKGIEKKFEAKIIEY